MQDRQQIIHPLTENMLGMFTQIYDGVDEESAELLKDLKKARPGSFDTETVNAVKKQYTERIEYLDCGEKQFHAWLASGTATKKQSTEINRLLYIIEKTRVITIEILELCQKLEKTTIEKLMNKSEIETVADFFSQNS